MPVVSLSPLPPIWPTETWSVCASACCFAKNTSGSPSAFATRMTFQTIFSFFQPTHTKQSWNCILVSLGPLPQIWPLETWSVLPSCWKIVADTNSLIVWSIVLKMLSKSWCSANWYCLLLETMTQWSWECQSRPRDHFVCINTIFTTWIECFVSTFYPWNWSSWCTFSPWLPHLLFQVLNVRQ